jgi:hypothetical protein
MQLAERDDVERVQVLLKHTAGSAPGSSPEWRACFQRSDERVGYFRVVLAQRVRGLMPLASGLCRRRKHRQLLLKPAGSRRC